ncbi:gamma-glutamylcyclotransferase [Halieaceae bacterium IMCC14734]|uniref:Gamma-glutamylcyclotransferase n=1 Tax=Candidatus Litorirhabdus singularis TaxID=2518993 RepID=A0ABT3TH56_9GAMM|nr:gamma-glutamylcyclotransferase [Candidatus Litorirhabdus singularis]MCX2981091.1 gamma-glutamylcyclotransferase [Candidatus Litorirhabdus singularis]
MSALKYFAYGSNMSSARLLARTPSAHSLGIHVLPRHQLLFHKAGKDGSGKCNAFYSGNEQHSVIGILYELDGAEKPILDRIEGVGWGYEISQVQVSCPEGVLHSCFTYSAIRIAENLPPYTWYLNHVLTGARAARLPHDYVADIAATPATQDPDKKRHNLEMSLYQSP